MDIIHNDGTIILDSFHWDMINSGTGGSLLLESVECFDQKTSLY